MVNYSLLLSGTATFGLRTVKAEKTGAKPGRDLVKFTLNKG